MELNHRCYLKAEKSGLCPARTWLRHGESVAMLLLESIQSNEERRQRLQITEWPAAARNKRIRTYGQALFYCRSAFMPSGLYYTEGRASPCEDGTACLLGTRALRCYKGKYCKRLWIYAKPCSIVSRHSCRHLCMYNISCWWAKAQPTVSVAFILIFSALQTAT